MNIDVLDRSKYLKGLLVVARKDAQLTDPEKEIIRNIAQKLGFAADFYKETIHTLLQNKYISDEPIKFSDRKIAESFIKDGLLLGFSDHMISDSELNWMRTTAEVNGISADWFDRQLKHHAHKSDTPEYALYSLI